MTTAQTLYDLRADYAFCSGTDLHEFFRAQTGDPSPSGKVELDKDAAFEFVRASVEAQTHNAPNLTGWGQRAMQGARRRINQPTTA